jgi:DNA-binding NarL/FixJ family response regulator
MGFLEVLALALAVLAECCILQGDLAEAEAAIGRLERQLDGGTVLPERAWAQALCLDGRDRPVEALEVLAPTVSQLSHGCLIFASRQADRLPWLVHLALRAGDSGQAAAVAKAAGELARRNPGARLFAATDAHARGLLGTEPALLETAVGLLAECEWPLATAAAREDLAQALTEQNRREQAVEQLEAAYASYVECNAHRSAARARRALRDLGVRKPRTAAGSRADNGNLTSAELAVVRIVAQGRTNKEAAAQLFVSPDTINTHLKHAFAKLGVRSRVELARLPLPQ